MAVEGYGLSFGKEEHDKTYRPPPTLQWSLQPLQLPADHPAFEPPTSFIPSLTSLALTVISRNLESFSPDSFQHVPLVLIRKVFIRARDDRGYDQEEITPFSLPCPDKTSLWALETLASIVEGSLPRDTQPHTTLLPTTAFLHSLSNPMSPLRTLIPFTSFTSLNLSQARSALNDETCLNLRHLTNLTVLDLSSTEITDLGLRKLASCLDAGDGTEKRGMWGLKTLVLRKCRRVSDRGVGALARYGGLCVLDIRETSCTQVAITLINRQVKKLFPGLATFESTNPHVQTTKRALFSVHSTSEQSVSAVLRCAGIEAYGARLHIHGTDRDVPENQWPIRTCSSKTITTKQPIYRDSGIGNVYGPDVAAIPNPSTVALWQRNSERIEAAYGEQGTGKRKGSRRISGKRTGLFDDEQLERYNSRMGNASGAASARGEPLVDAQHAFRAYLASRLGPLAPDQPAVHPWGSSMYATPSERSRAFIAPPSTAPVVSHAERRAKLQAKEKFDCPAYLMLARQVPHEWELPRASAQISEAPDRETPVHLRKRQSATALSAVGGGSQVELLIGALDARTAVPAASKRPRRAQTFSQETVTGSGDRPVGFQPKPSTSRPMPGVSSKHSPSLSPEPRPLLSFGSTRKRPPSPGLVPRPLPPLKSTTPIVPPPLPAPSKLARQNPFKSAPKPTSGGVVSLGFESSASKRRWGGADPPHDPKRRGMVMFGAKR